MTIIMQVLNAIGFFFGILGLYGSVLGVFIVFLGVAQRDLPVLKNGLLAIFVGLIFFISPSIAELYPKLPLALTLFLSAITTIIPCACITYTITRKTMIPWAGGTFLVTEDGSLLPVKWCYEVDYMWQKWQIGNSTKIKGVFLAGVRANAMPYVGFERSSENLYCKVVEAQNGVYVYCSEILQKTETSAYVSLYISAPYQFLGSNASQDKTKKEYYAHSTIYFEEKDKVLDQK